VWVSREFKDLCGCLIEIWQGGSLFYGENQLDAVKKALVDFQQKRDTKAQLILTLAYSSGGVCTIVMISLFLTDVIDSSV
jgi:hypothetical protein